MTDQILLSRKQAAEALAISETKLDLYVRAGMIKVRKIGRSVLFHRSELERFASRDQEEVFTRFYPRPRAVQRLGS